ncbi:MAG: hypothetical protein JSW17_06975 [Candidatus Omnitrophota bacterium]|nr:MAG: hypothetical protein JSW17_06975 [Candidatus Omnitrophota bacterium]
MNILKRVLLKKINLKGVATHNIWLKIISLLIAIVVWIYVSGEITKGVRI